MYRPDASVKQAGETELEFATTLANCIHDIKNSAAIVMSGADAIAAGDAEPAVRGYLNSLQFEARKINHGLMHLLGLYKIEHRGSAIRRDVVDCGELLMEIAAYNAPLTQSLGLSVVLDTPAYVEGFFDREMIFGILNTVLNNAQRHAKTRVRMTAARADDDYTVLGIEDDGPGYPDAMLGADAPDAVRDTSYRLGNTGLGLFFARRIAALHHDRGRSGFVELSNDGLDGGASFRLWLP